MENPYLEQKTYADSLEARIRKIDVTIRRLSDERFLALNDLKALKNLCTHKDENHLYDTIGYPKLSGGDQLYCKLCHQKC